MGGGTILKASDFAAITDAKILNRLDPSVREKVVVCDLAKKGVVSLEPFVDHPQSPQQRYRLA